MVRGLRYIIEIGILSALILGTRCANYQEVFVGGNTYFTDPDCYARMTRVRMCAEHPGLVVRHQNFENFPAGTTPHTTAPLDYLIFGISVLLKPLTAHPLDLAGALISPLLALVAGWFLWWWSRRMGFRYRWTMLILYAVSPILVHGGELGRPDHQSLSILLVMIAICAEWTLHREPTKQWSAASAIAWGLAIWVSAYEPAILFVIVLVFMLVIQSPFARHRRVGWISFAAITAIALLLERRVPSLSPFYSSAIFKNWAGTIGELAPVSPNNPIWLRWGGYLLLVAPILVWFGLNRSMNRRNETAFIVMLLTVTYFLTIWQARWAYFFVLLFALALSSLLEPIRSRMAVWIAFALSIFPILRDWDERLWPNESEIARRIEQRNESIQVRDLASGLKSSSIEPFVAPWWLSPAIAYWSGQPGVAGSSHESLEGIADSALFFLVDDWQTARRILENHRAAWVLAYDAQRVAQNSSAIVGLNASGHSVCFVMDRTPTQVPRFLIFSAQNDAAKLYRVVNKL